MQAKPVEWSKNATIYEVNIRQYTPEGTINAFSKHLQELDSLGVDILWIMPIYPVGVLNHKGNMGSAYAVKDYCAVNPDFGSLQDLKNMVNQAHALGMHVILDWIANHTAWDNHLTIEHPEWYNKDSLGSFIPPVPDWADVIDLNYDNQELRTYMINSLKFWIEKADVDGFRCDMAMLVPTDFWESARTKLDSIKPVFMLAEAEQPDLMNKAFDMNYGWEIFHLMNDMAQGKANVSKLDAYFSKYDTVFSSDDYRMNFTSNHDENAWNGTVKERLGDAAKTMAVLTYIIPGMPLIYSGQEVGLDKRLSFFDKDTIQWHTSPWREFYTKLNALKKSNKSLWNGAYGGAMKRIHTNSDESIFAIKRKKDDQEIVAVFNLSNKEHEVTFPSGFEPMHLTNYFDNQEVTVGSGSKFSLDAWGYLILTKQ